MKVISTSTAATSSAALIGLEMWSAGSGPSTRKVACGSPIRSISPCRIRGSASLAANSPNLMLDEPPLIVRMQAVSDLTAGPCVIRRWSARAVVHNDRI